MSQFGKKAGKHLKEFGLNPQLDEDRNTYRNMIADTFRNFDEQRLVKWDVDPDTGLRTIEALTRRKMELLLLTRLDGRFISLFNGASSNKRYQEGRKI